MMATMHTDLAPKRCRLTLHPPTLRDKACDSAPVFARGTRLLEFISGFSDPLGIRKVVDDNVIRGADTWSHTSLASGLG